jgi:sulfatase modifying factor 1
VGGWLGQGRTSGVNLSSAHGACDAPRSWCAPWHPGWSHPIFRAIAWLFALTLVGALQRSACADSFGSGVNSFTIDFVAIGNPGNPPDANPNPAGAVPYSYRIGKYEISEQMIEKANALGSLGITKDSRGADFPATSVSWYEAAQLVNWLNTSKGHSPAYKFDSAGVFQLWLPTDPGCDATNLFRNKQAKYFLPSTNEWHKAAYFDPVLGVYYDYPTGSDSVPDGVDFIGDAVFDSVFFDGASKPDPNDIFNVGISSPSGAFGLGGNVFEWDETAFDRTNDLQNEQRRASGGSWQSQEFVFQASNTLGGTAPGFQGLSVGFRISSVVPEPASSLLLLAIVLAAWRRKGDAAHFLTSSHSPLSLMACHAPLAAHPGE